MAVEYGTIAVVPMGTWEDSKDYNVGNLVELDGSSYVAKVKPPAGTSPTDTAYWQVSAKGASKATADIAGVVKPDGVTTEVDANASLSVKKATQATVGIVKGSNGIKVGAEGSIDVDTTFTQATDLANIIAGEAIASVLGKVSKAIATTMSLDQNALLKNMLTSIDGNSSEKVPTQAYIHTLVERIGMGIELTAGANLTEVANELSSNLGEHFSEAERQIGTWMGKPLYRQCFHPTVDIAAGTQSYNISLGLSGVEVAMIDYAHTWCMGRSNTDVYCIPYVHNDAVNNVGAFLIVENADVKFAIRKGTNTSIRSIWITLTYTKTTDS